MTYVESPRGGVKGSNQNMNRSLARERLAWLEFPHSLLDETTTFKQEKSLVIGSQVCHGLGYWSTWAIIIIIIKFYIYIYIYLFMYYIFIYLYIYIFISYMLCCIFMS